MRNGVVAAIWLGVGIAITAFVADSLQRWRLSQVRTHQAVVEPQDLPYNPPFGQAQQVSGIR